MSERFYVTTPIYYITDVPHLGSAYSTIAADVLCRYHRLRGAAARFLTGTDEHGLKIQREAERRGVQPRQLADQMAERFRVVWPQLGCAPDDFIRTCETRHQEGVQELWRIIRDAGDIYLGHYEGLYCVGCEAYYTSKELTQPGNLCPLHGTPAEAVKEESYFFRLSRYTDRLLAFYESHPEFVQPVSRMNEVKSFVKGGLQDLSVSRTTFRWGIEVPDDSKHVMYVWFDALSNYWTALQKPDDNRRFWPASVHVVGKDILRFHAVYWPAFLMAAGFADDQLPGKVLAHGFLTYGGRKMSKSLRNTISPLHLAQALSPSVGVDTLRYCLMRSVSFGQDGDFSIDELLQRYAADLGNTLGNLLNRIFPFAPPTLGQAKAEQLENELAAHLSEAARKAADAYDGCSPTRALEAIWAALAAANSYVDKAAPWVAKKKQQSERLNTIVLSVAQALEAVSVLVAPVMPQVANMVRLQLGLETLEPRVGADQWPWQLPQRSAGSSLAPGEPIFPRLDKKQIAEIHQQFAAPEAEPANQSADDATESAGDGKTTIEFDDFGKLDLRVGVVVAAEKVKKKDRLLDLRVDVGEATARRIVAGIAQHYSPEQLVGRRVIVLCNLAPRKFSKKLVSEGMLLAATGADQKVALLGVDGELAGGSTIR